MHWVQTPRATQAVVGVVKTDALANQISDDIS
jgi:hypothetical protein